MTSTPPIRCCQVCGSNRFELVHQNTLTPLNGLDLSTDIGFCVNCSHLQAFHLQSVENYELYYQSLSKTDYPKVLSALDAARFSMAVDLAQQYSNIGMTAADIGCGGGSLLAALQHVGLTPVLGLDPGVGAAAHAMKHHGLRIVEQGFMATAAVRIGQTQPDLIFLMAVLEHLHDARRDTEALVMAMKLGAKLIVEVPAIEGFDGACGEPLGEFSLEHIQFFSAGTLQYFMHDLGLSLLQCDVVPWPDQIGSSLFAVFVKTDRTDIGKKPHRETADLDSLRRMVKRYVEVGCRRLQQAVDRIPTEGSLVVYGAGAHTARMLPHMTDDALKRVHAIVDGNPNLHGKHIGHHVIQPPERIRIFPDAKVVLSSYRCQEELAQQVQMNWKNQVVRLYSKPGVEWPKSTSRTTAHDRE